MSSLDNIRLAIDQKATGVTGDQHSPWSRVGNAPGETLAVGSRWATGVGETKAAWQNLGAPVNKGQPNERAPGPADIAARTLRAAQGTIGGIMGALGAPKEMLDLGFANLTAPLAAIFPSLPAATITSPYLGTPHAHVLHPPSGPAPIPPTPCPSFGMTMLGVSPRVLINSKPAARVEDIGLAPTCMGLPPAWFKIKTGSSNVFIGGNRAARFLDISKACKTIPEVPSIPAGRVLAAIGKGARAVSSAMQVAGKVAGGLGIAADLAEAAVEDDKEFAAAQALNAAMNAVQMAADRVKQAVEKTMWKDPAVPPTGSLGAVIDPSNANVLIGGFPMIDIPDPVGALLNRLGRYTAKAPPANKGCGEEGEPVDVVTGANLEVSLDLPLHSPLDLTWCRYYDSSQADQRGPLGWGWRHELQGTLRFDLDGILYGPASRPAVPFPHLTHDGDASSNSGWTLRRVDAQRYHLERTGAPTFEFFVPADSDAGRLESVARNKQELQLRYDTQGRLTRVVGGTHSPLDLYYDERELLVRLAVPRDRAAPRTVLIYDYDDNQDLVSWTDALGNRATLEYDDRHRLTRKGDRRGYSYFYVYDEQGRCVHTHGEDGMYDVRLAYFPAMRSTTATHADGGRWTFFYDENGTIKRIVDPYGNSRERLTDASGRVVSEIDAAGNEYRILYDTAGGSVGRQDQFGYLNPDLADLRRYNPLALLTPSTALEWEHGAALPVQLIHGKAAPDARFDALGRKVEEATAERGVRRWVHDENGNVVEYWDADGGRHRKQITSWNLLHRDTDPVGNSTEYAYTARERVAYVRDPGGSATEYVYDLRDNVACVRRDGTVREQYRRDSSDNLIEKLDGAGKTLLSFEIGLGNLTTARRLASGDTHRFAYDRLGRLLVAATDSHETRFEYGDSRRPISDTRDGRGVRYHTALRRRSHLVILERFELRYAADGESAWVIDDPSGGRHRVQAHRDGTIVLHLSNGSKETQKYDYNGRCLSKTRHWLQQRQPWTRTYRYTAEGDLIFAEDTRRGTTGYEYDAAHRILATIQPDGQRLHFEHDRAGNLISHQGLSGVVVGPGNRLIAHRDESFTYNDRGHIASRTDARGFTRFEYDSCGRLVGCSTRDGEWSSTYDPLGRRATKVWRQGRSDYYYDDNRLAAERGPDGRLRIYVYSDRYALAPFMFVDYESENAPTASGRRYFVASNQIAAPIRIDDENGDPVWQAAVDPYGTTRVRHGSRVEYALRFPGHYEDAELGLFYNRFRHYDPGLGRYLQSDPLGLAGGTNLYAYTSNPLTRVDLFGLHPPKTEDDDGTAPKTGPDEEIPPGMTKKEFDDLRAEMNERAAAVWKLMKEANERGDRTITLPDGTVLKTSDSGMRPCLSIVKDLQTGEIFFGQNTGKQPENLTPQLQKRADVVAAVNEASSPAPEKYPTGWSRDKGTPGSHSEVQALNQGMEARPGAQPNEFAVHNVRTEDNRNGNAGDPMERCDNCKPITDGIIPLTD